ncbi:hypothetical protein L1887_32667 [Cichorium endivia]|nr:hypothetical protein L1887_32667 [Cichorium endivia]
MSALLRFAFISSSLFSFVRHSLRMDLTTTITKNTHDPCNKLHQVRSVELENPQPAATVITSYHNHHHPQWSPQSSPQSSPHRAATTYCLLPLRSYGELCISDLFDNFVRSIWKVLQPKEMVRFEAAEAWDRSWSWVNIRYWDLKLLLDR